MKPFYSLISLSLLFGACDRVTEPDPVRVGKAKETVGSASATVTAGSLAPKGDVKELQKTDEVVGNGAEAVSGKRVTVHYTGTLTNGEKFDSSRDRNQPFSFKLGAGEVIKGWDQGVAGMKVGGKRKLVIPGSMAYGERGSPPKIGPNATLLFDVELLKVDP